jgi:hypothetical protein
MLDLARTRGHRGRESFDHDGALILPLHSSE